jgi:hypothetical protein
MKVLCIAILQFILITSSVEAGLFSPSTFEECVLDNMKGVSSDVAAGIVYNTCREKFPLKIPKKCKEKSKKYLLYQVNSIRRFIFEDDYKNCIEECKSAGYYSNTFGECKYE